MCVIADIVKFYVRRFRFRSLLQEGIEDGEGLSVCICYNISDTGTNPSYGCSTALNVLQIVWVKALHCCGVSGIKLWI